MEITLHGLTQRQIVFADIFWTLGTRDRVQSFISSLPQAEQIEAVTVLHLLVAALTDEIVKDDLAEAQAVIRKVK